MSVDRQTALWNDSQAMTNRRPSTFGQGYAVFAALENVDAHLTQARRKAATVAREIAWLEELRDLRAAQIARGDWP